MLHIAICDKDAQQMSFLENMINGILDSRVIISKHDNPFSLITYIVDEAKSEVDI